jgi:hypothetical protein
MRSLTERGSGYRVGLVMRRIALGIVLAVTAAVAVGTVAVAIAAALLVPDQVPVDMPLITLAVLAMVTVGSVLAIRVPANAIGLLLVVSALALGVEILGLAYSEVSFAVAGGSWPGTAIAAWLYSSLLAVPVVILVFTIPLIYPNGRLLSPRWRWLVGLVALSFVQSLAQAFRPGIISDTNVENPFGIAALVPFLDAMKAPAFGTFALPVLGGPIVSVVIRFRRGTRAERAQLKWLVAATTAAVFAWSMVLVGEGTGLTVLTTVGWYGGLLAFAGLPIAIGIAVLRYRLYEIDRIISRSIAWAVVTGVLVSVFAVGVVALQQLLTGVTQGGTVAVAISTLVAAALFQPLRRRVQHAVDRRFDRAKYDAQQTVEAFAERLRDEVALDAVADDLHQTVASSIKPTSFGLWLRPGRPRAGGRS